MFNEPEKGLYILQTSNSKSPKYNVEKTKNHRNLFAIINHPSQLISNPKHLAATS